MIKLMRLFLFFLLLQFFSNVLSQSTLTKKGLEVEENRHDREKRAFNPEGSIVSVRYNQPRTLLTVSIMDTANPNIVHVSETVGCPGTCIDYPSMCSCFNRLESQNSYDEKTGWLHTLYQVNSTHFGILSQHLLTKDQPLAFSFSGVSNIYYIFFDPKRKMLLFVGKRTTTTTNVEIFGLEVVNWINTAGSGKEEGPRTKRNMEVIKVEEIIPQSIFYFDQAVIDTDETWETRLAPLSMCYFDSPSGQLYLLPFVKGPGGKIITNGVDMMKMIVYDVEALTFLKSTLMTYVEDPFPASFLAFQVRASLSSLQLDGKTGTLYAVFKSSLISQDDSLYIIQFSPTTGKFSKVKLITSDPVCTQTPASTIDSGQSIFYIHCTPFLYNGWLPTLEVFKPVPSFIVDPHWITRTNKKMLNSSTSQDPGLNRLMGVVGKIEKKHVISGVLEQQISARTSAELKTYFEGELGNVEKGSCSHDSYFNTMYLLSDKNREALPNCMYAIQLSNISSPGQIAQEVELEQGDFRFFSTVFNPLTEEVYLLSCDPTRVRVERIPTTSGSLAGSTYTSLKTEGKVELASFAWEEQYSPGLLPNLHSMVVYPQCSFAYFLMDPNTQVGNSRIFSLNIETGELGYQNLVSMNEDIQGIHLTRGGLQVDYSTGYIWAIGCVGNCEDTITREFALTVLVQVNPETGEMFYNGTLVPKDHDDVYTLTALDQTKHHFYLQTKDAIYRAFLDPKKSLPSEDTAGKGLFFSEPLVPLMDIYDYKNFEITPECLLFMPSQLNFPLNEAGSGPCNSAHRPQATPSFATRTPTPTPTSPPTKTKGRSSGEIIGLASGGGFLAFLFIGSLIWWRSSSRLGHVPLEEEVEEAEEPPKRWRKWFGRRGTRHTRFEDEESIDLDRVTASGAMDGHEGEVDEDEEGDNQRLARKPNPKSLIVEVEEEEVLQRGRMVSRMRRDEEEEEEEDIAAQVATINSLKEQEGGRGRNKSTAAVEMKEMSRKGKEPEEEEEEEISIDIDY